MYKATLRVLLTDNIDKTEMLSVQEAMGSLGMDVNLNTIMDLINNKETLLSLEEQEWSYEVSFAIADQCIAATVLDGVLSRTECTELGKILRLLQFNSAAVKQIVDWGVSLSQCYSEGAKLQKNLHRYHAKE